MEIHNLSLKNFRNHQNKKYEFDKDLTLILGENGSGKTNILEAVYVLATGKSQRARYDKDLINYGHKFCTLGAEITNQQDKYLLELQIIKQDDETNYSSKKARVNKVVKSITGFTGMFNAVLFVPEDISIITGAPSERRRYLDLILSQSDRNYKRNLSSYVKSVRQRNSLLENINETGRGRNQLEFWNNQILALGTFLQSQRQEFIDYTNESLRGLIKELDSPKSQAFINYKENKITRERLEKYLEREIAAKTTLLGPHRDDFDITLNGYSIAEFGSRGQQRTLIVSLKLIEIGFIEKTKGERPVLLLDDIFSELDDKHRHTLFSILDKQQTIITSAESEKILGIDFGHRIEL